MGRQVGPAAIGQAGQVGPERDADAGEPVADRAHPGEHGPASNRGARQRAHLGHVSVDHLLAVRINACRKHVGGPYRHLGAAVVQEARAARAVDLRQHGLVRGNAVEEGLGPSGPADQQIEDGDAHPWPVAVPARQNALRQRIVLHVLQRAHSGKLQLHRRLGRKERDHDRQVPVLACRLVPENADGRRALVRRRGLVRRHGAGRGDGRDDRPGILVPQIVEGAAAAGHRVQNGRQGPEPGG